MTRLKITKCVDSFLKDLSSRTPLEQLATVEANPGLMLPAMSSKDRLDTLDHYRSVCRLLAHTRPGTSVAQSHYSRVLHATGKAKTMLKKNTGTWGSNFGSGQEGSFCSFELGFGASHCGADGLP